MVIERFKNELIEVWRDAKLPEYVKLIRIDDEQDLEVAGYEWLTELVELENVRGSYIDLDGFYDLETGERREINVVTVIHDRVYINKVEATVVDNGKYAYVHFEDYVRRCL